MLKLCVDQIQTLCAAADELPLLCLLPITFYWMTSNSNCSRRTGHAKPTYKTILLDSRWASSWHHCSPVVRHTTLVRTFLLPSRLYLSCLLFGRLRCAQCSTKGISQEKDCLCSGSSAFLFQHVTWKLSVPGV